MRTRDRRPRILTARDNAQSRSPSAKCFEFLREFRWPLSPRSVYTILPDEDIEIGGLSDCSYCWNAGGGRRGREYRWREARGSGAQPRWGPGAMPQRGIGGGAPRLSRSELKMFHEQILSQNEAWFVKIRKQMTTEKKEQLHYAMVHRSVLQWTRGEIQEAKTGGWHTSNNRIARVASCIEAYFSLQMDAKPELAHCLQTSKMRRNSTSLNSCQHDDIKIVTVFVARRSWTAPLKPRKLCV